MTFLLDTNVVSTLRATAGARAEPRVIAWADAVDPKMLFLSAISVYELELGVLMKERRDPRQGSILRSWLDEFVRSAVAGRVLDVTEAIAARTAALHVPDPKPERDSFIGGTALVHGLTVVTRSVADFRSMGVSILNPWDN